MTVKSRCLTVSFARQKDSVLDLVGDANILSSKRQRIRTSRHSKSVENLKKSPTYLLYGSALVLGNLPRAVSTLMRLLTISPRR